MAQYHLKAETYMQMIREELPLYDEIQKQISNGMDPALDVRTILDLGTGTGETLAGAAHQYPNAQLAGLDNRQEMVKVAQERFEGNGEFHLLDLSQPLPGGPYDLVVSALAIHHLEGELKRGLFERVRSVLNSQGQFVFGDVILPEKPIPSPTPCEEGVDFPSSKQDLLTWLGEAGFSADVTWEVGDLAVFRCRRN